MTEPAIITQFRECLDRGNGITIVARSCAGLGVRPTLLAEKANGERIYRLTDTQVRKVLAKWDEAMS